MDYPKISIIVPCYNQEEFLDSTLNSVLKQTYPHWECIIIDDGSTDSTLEIARCYENTDKRFRLFSIKNQGLAHARNFGIEKSVGELIQFLDGDDILVENRFEICLENLKSYNVLVSNFKYFENNISQSIDPNFQLDQSFLRFNQILMLWPLKNIPIHCGFFRADLFKKIRFQEELKACEDWVMWLELFSEPVKPLFLDRTLAYYRRHNKSMTWDFRRMNFYRIKAVNYIINSITMENDIKCYFTELQKNKTRANQLAITIENYRNTRVFRFSNVIKKVLSILNLRKTKI